MKLVFGNVVLDNQCPKGILQAKLKIICILLQFITDMTDYYYLVLSENKHLLSLNRQNTSQVVYKDNLIIIEVFKF